MHGLSLKWKGKPPIMPRKPPSPHPKGAPRTPGSGRKRGTPNKKTQEVRQLMATLIADVKYQHRLREDFCRRRIHPSTEATVWSYVLGTPEQHLKLTGDVVFDQRLAAEREMLRMNLDLQELEELATKSQELLDRALAVARARRESQVQAELKDVGNKGNKGAS